MEVRELYEELQKRLGKQNWWPTKSNNEEEEILIGAILTQQTKWENVEKAINNLMRSNLLSLDRIVSVPLRQLEELIRPCGFARVKAKRLKQVAKLVLKRYSSLGDLLALPLDSARKALLELPGIGYETCDAILLYAGNKPIFVVDRYTHRLFVRLGLWKGNYSYERLRKFVEARLPREVAIYKEFHALIDVFAKRICAADPRCESCFLRNDCKRFKEGRKR